MNLLASLELSLENFSRSTLITTATVSPVKVLTPAPSLSYPGIFGNSVFFINTACLVTWAAIFAPADTSLASMVLLVHFKYVLAASDCTLWRGNVSNDSALSSGPPS